MSNRGSAAGGMAAAPASNNDYCRYSNVIRFLVDNMDRFVDTLKVSPEIIQNARLKKTTLAAIIARQVPLDGMDWSCALPYDWEIASANPYCIDLLMLEENWERGRVCIHELCRNPSPRAVELLERIMKEKIERGDNIWGHDGVDVLYWASSITTVSSPHVVVLFQKYLPAITAVTLARERTHYCVPRNGDWDENGNGNGADVAAAAAAKAEFEKREKLAQTGTRVKIQSLFCALCKNPYACEWVIQEHAKWLEEYPELVCHLARCSHPAAVQYVLDCIQTEKKINNGKFSVDMMTRIYNHLSHNPCAAEWILQQETEKNVPIRWEFFVSNPHPAAVSRTVTFLSGLTVEQKKEMGKKYWNELLSYFSGNPGAVTELLKNKDWIRWGSFSGNVGLVTTAAV